MADIHVHVHEESVHSLETKLDTLAQRMEVLMATVAALTAALDAINTVTNTISANVDKVIVNEAAQIVEIKSLKDFIAGGGAVTQAQLDALVTAAEARRTALQSVSASLLPIATDPANPAPAPAPVDPNTEV